jgi:hypothetical protein
VAADGYGVSYIIASEDLIFFHISSNKSSPETVIYWSSDIDDRMFHWCVVKKGFKTIWSMYSSSYGRHPKIIRWKYQSYNYGEQREIIVNFSNNITCSRWCLDKWSSFDETYHCYLSVANTIIDVARSSIFVFPISLNVELWIFFAFPFFCPFS